MKKIANAFIVLFVFALLCSNNLFAQAGSYETVTGINNPADANGRYVMTGSLMTARMEDLVISIRVVITIYTP